MANTTNQELAPGEWTLIASGQSGSISNTSPYDAELFENDGVPAARLSGHPLRADRGAAFELLTGQHLYARSRERIILAITLE